MTMTPLRVNLSGDDAAIARAIAGWRELARRPSETLVDYEASELDWKRALVEQAADVSVTWADGAELFRSPGTVVYVVLPDVRCDARSALDRLSGLPWQLASFPPIHDAWLETAPRHLGFGRGMGSFGWACAFRGDGHDRLVSRRWLDHGPWAVVRGDHDTTLVQFHDLAAAPAVALEQALPGHALLGICDTGGFLQASYVYRHAIAGSYDASARRLLVDVAGGEVDPVWMRDLCAARRRGTDDAGHPIAHVGARFARRADAERQVGALWLRELECWSNEGGLVRHDLDYHPAQHLPDWLRAGSRLAPGRVS